MKKGWWRHRGLCAALVALGLVLLGGAASAQVDDGDCRCVDADGNAIENCTCFVMPEVPDVSELMAWGPDGDFAVSLRVRPRLGVTVSTEQDDALDAQGAQVTDVLEDGPADDAGIREGDIITSVDGRSLFQPLDDDAEGDLDLDESIPVQRLLAIARELEPGESVQVGYLRDGQERTADVEVADLGAYWGAWARQFNDEFRPRFERFRQEMRPRVQQFQRELRPQIDQLREQIREQSAEWEINGRPFVFGGAASRQGLDLTELTPGLGDYFGAEDGVLVTDVEADSPLGLQAGDVILRVGDRDATSPQRVWRILASYEGGESVTFRVLRRGSEIDLMGRLPD